MLKTLVCLLVLLGSSPSDAFKKEAKPLETALDGIVAANGSRITQSSKASLVDGYGVVLTMEMAFEAPALPPPFGPPRNVPEIKAAVERRRKDLQEKMPALVTDRVMKLESVGPDETFTIAIRVFNTSPDVLPNLPMQITCSAKKQSPPQVMCKEF